MQSNWSFNDLDLTGVEAQRGGRTLKARDLPYVCRTSDAEITKTQAGGRQLKVKLNEVNGAGYVVDYITLTHPKQATDSGAATSVRIGQERLKALLECGGHPNPNKPGDVKAMNNLIVGVRVEEGEPWVDDKGVTRKGGGKPAKNGAYVKADAATAGSAAAPAAAAPAGVDDDIPF